VNGEGKPAFPNAAIHLSAPEWEYLSGMTAEKARSNGIEHHSALAAAVEPKIDAFAPGAALVPGTVEAVEVKGHTPGHSAYRITSGGESLLYVGDSMHHYVVPVQKPDWTNGFDGDVATDGRREPRRADIRIGGERSAHLRRALPIPRPRQVRGPGRGVRVGCGMK
jgi:glyoxylase-like metal-dependent hydrolase (beta-lactamase superfamily II)